MRDIAKSVVRRWSAGWADALAAAIGAGIAWALAHILFGHPQPVFAAVATLVCLAPGLPSRGRQAVNMMLGLVTGILVGEALLLIPIYNVAVRIAIIAFTAMMAALSFGLAPVIAIQGGVSAILVIAMGPITAGPTRLMDAVIGTAVALTFSQILFTPDPVRVIDSAVRQMLRLMAHGFAQAAEAAAERNQAKAEAALSHFFTSRDSLDAVVAGINAARSLSRWSLRGRFAAAGIAEIARRYDRRAIRLFASTLLLAESLANALRKGQEPPPWLSDRLDRVASACAVLADGFVAAPACRIAREREAGVVGWEACVGHLWAVEATLAVLQEAKEQLEPGRSGRRTL